METHRLQELLSRPGKGIYSVCSAHPWVVQAAVEQAVEDRSLLLIEATSNQVNQLGGYTGMRPADFRAFVETLATKGGLPLRRLILGGDHLGPNPWRHLPAAVAMHEAEIMVREYVAAGFTKIHLDASMGCADEPHVLSDTEVASRAVRLAAVAEAARPPGGEAPVYIIGTEVPTPGGATHALEGLQITSDAAAEQTWQIHRSAFHDSGMHDAWSRVIALVVQPGVEFGHASVIEYDREKAARLIAWRQQGNGPLTFEAHSTDYQLPQAYPALVEDGFGILKVGPALTFAMREALFALEHIERMTVPAHRCSYLAATLESCMLAEPKDWATHYTGSGEERQQLRKYSYSDRIRYYWNKPAAEAAVATLIGNLSAQTIDETLLSQYLPVQYGRVREHRLQNEPIGLVIDQIRDVLRMYSRACPPA